MYHIAFFASRGGKLPDKAEAAVEDYSEVVRLMEEDPESSEGLRKGCRGWNKMVGGQFLVDTVERKDVKLEDLNGLDLMKGKIAC